MRKGLQIAQCDDMHQVAVFKAIYEAKDMEKSQIEALVSRKLTAAGVTADTKGKKKHGKKEEGMVEHVQEKEISKRKSVPPELFATQVDASARFANKRKKKSAKKKDTGIINRFSLRLVSVPSFPRSSASAW